MPERYSHNSLIKLAEMVEIYMRLEKEGVNRIDDVNISPVARVHMVEFECDTKEQLLDKIKASERDLGVSMLEE